MKKMIASIAALCIVLWIIPCLALELLSAGEQYPMDASDQAIIWYCQDSLKPHESYADWHDSPFHNQLSAQLGVQIKWLFPPSAAENSSYLHTLLADPAGLPHIMDVYWSQRAVEYLDEEMIWDLTPYLQEYAPAYHAWLKAHPAYDRAAKTDDGRYYAFRFFQEDGGLFSADEGLVIRTDWLDECGLTLPRTTSELENVLHVFRQQYGAAFCASWSRFKQSPALCGQFGGYASAAESWYVKDGKVGLGQMDDSYRQYLSWLNRLYQEGLLDPDLLTVDDSTIMEKVINGKTGVAYTTLEQLERWNRDCAAAGIGAVWAACPYPIGDDGTLSAIAGGSGMSDRTIVITRTADENTLKLCLRALDYAYTQEGWLFWNYGLEGDTWQRAADGKPVYTKKLTSDGDPNALARYTGTRSACIQASDQLRLTCSQTALQAADIWFHADPDDSENNLTITSGWRWPDGATYSIDEQDELDIIDGPISTYCSENFTSFLLGKQDVNDDAVWEKYLKKFDRYNYEEIQEIRQACYDRYLAR